MKINKHLNLELISRKAQELGLNQANISKKLNISREAVSKWFKKESIPTAGKLYKLANLLELSFDEIIKISYDEEPLVSFRKNKNANEKNDDREFGIRLSKNLEKLLPYVPFNYLTKPPILINPKVDHLYIQEVVKVIRDDMNLKSNVVTTNDLINIFSLYHAVLIPVLWGKRTDHINGIRIFLKESMTNWVYLNLDVNQLDFKFWMAHELGHIISPKLSKPTDEEFADHFAGALLFPDLLAEDLYEHLILMKSNRQRVNEVIGFSQRLNISPITIYKRVNEYAKYSNKKEINLDSDIYKTTTFVNKHFKQVTDLVFNNTEPNAHKYIQFVNEELRSPFFIILRKFIKDNKISSIFVKEILDVSITDAQNIYEAL